MKLLISIYLFGNESCVNICDNDDNNCENGDDGWCSQTLLTSSLI